MVGEIITISEIKELHINFQFHWKKTMKWHFAGFVPNTHGFSHLVNQICPARHKHFKIAKLCCNLVHLNQNCAPSHSAGVVTLLCRYPWLNDEWPNVSMSLCLHTFWNQTQIFKIFNNEKQHLLSILRLNWIKEIKKNTHWKHFLK